MRFRGGFIFLSVMAAAGLAGADALSDQRTARFREWDRNGNGVLEKGEYAGHPGNFRALDTDDNGVLSVAEFVHRGQAAPLDDALAVPAAPIMADHFAILDTNRNGVLSRSEWTGQNVAFHRADVNGDRVISRREYQDRPAANMEEAKFDGLDLNHDGVLARREWPTSAGVGFDVADRNDDGAVTFMEYVSPTRPREVVEERFEDMDRNNDGVLTRREWRGDLAVFESRDDDRDGVVSWREFRRDVASDPREDRFRQLDRNKDRRISRSEWRGDTESFRILDRSRDGYVNRAEFLDTRRLQDRFGYLDRDANGVLSRREWLGTGATFTNVDANRDGRVTRDEFMLL
jgi:Ca2+-binding EF-hand superfamily protein